MTHELKTWPEYFKAVENGYKTFEIRKNDRSYKVGDILILREFRPCKICKGEGYVFDFDCNTRLVCNTRFACDCMFTKNPKGKYTGRKTSKVITYITDFKQQDDFVVIGFKNNLV